MCIRDSLTPASAARGCAAATIPVSYTHLDVYKRQVPGAVALLLYDCLAAPDDGHGTSEAGYRVEDLNYFFKELAASLKAEGYRVVVAFSGFGTKEGTGKDKKTEPKIGLPAGCEGWGEAIVDHADTFWGQIALVDVIRKGAEGHYGFQAGSSGIFPANGKEER